MGWGQGRGRCLRAPKEALSFLSKVLIPVGGWGGGQVDPCLPRGPREPPEGLGRGQGAGADRGAVRAQTWQEDEGKELLHCRGGARSQHGQSQGEGALTGSGPHMGLGASGQGGGGGGCQGPFLPGWLGPRAQQPPWWDGWGGDLIHSAGGGSRGQSAPWGPAEPGGRGREGRQGRRERSDGERGWSCPGGERGSGPAGRRHPSSGRPPAPLPSRLGFLEC